MMLAPDVGEQECPSGRRRIGHLQPHRRNEPTGLSVDTVAMPASVPPNRISLTPKSRGRYSDSTGSTTTGHNTLTFVPVSFSISVY